MKTKIAQDKQRFTLTLSKSHGYIESKRRKNRRDEKGNEDMWFYLGFVGEIGYAIALPIVGGALIGTLIDRHISVYPKATLVLLFIGSIVSVLGFIRTIQSLLQHKN